MAPITTTEQEDFLDRDEIEVRKVEKYLSMMIKVSVYLFVFMEYILLTIIVSAFVRISVLALTMGSKILNVTSLNLTYLLDQYPEITMIILFVLVVWLHRYAIKKKEE